ncbi:hypothetical protein PIIN_10056 [Serendipita indica DSM 11827]|uniref:Uncharacterized protein n=1 Tax=Serendipita indica (strain DSM 11827) TaxID=1109443 RepID=G4TXL3_SERID|nr:hypothetical protein PIIN_10056 [Serendipita indica DSM 11827]
MLHGVAGNEDRLLNIQSEAGVILKLILYTMGSFSDVDLEEEMSVPLGTPLCSRLFGTDPAPDYVVRIRQSELGNWPRQLRPCVFVQEPKTVPSPTARAQLAMSCVTTLLILTRAFTYSHQPGDRMPAWMVVHGIVHTREGFTWYAHYPRAVGISNENGKIEWKWEWVMDDIIAGIYDQLGELEDNAGNFLFE